MSIVYYSETEVVARVRGLTVSRLRDLDEDAAALDVGLVDQIHGLRHQLRRLGEAVAEEHPEIRARIAGRITPR